MVETKAVLVAEGLAVDYGYGKVVDHMDLSVEPGKILVIVGGNGAGKTSTLRAIAGFVDTKEGKVSLDGVDISHLASFRRARKGITIVPEDRGLFPPLDVLDHLWLGSKSRRRPTKAELEAVFDVFPVLSERSNQKVGSLSGGEQQMLTLGMALLAKPTCLLIDELSMGLAPIIVTRLLENIRHLADTTSTAIILVEQFVAQALEIADEAIVMARGRTTLRGHGPDLRQRMDDVTAAYFAEGRSLS